MTTKNIYTIHDTVADFYSPTFQAENDNHAIRMFSQAIDLDHKHDFSLWLVGTFSSEKGTLKASQETTLILHGKALKNKEQN